jgi:hypothetical protein
MIAGPPVVTLHRADLPPQVTQELGKLLESGKLELFFANRGSIRLPWFIALAIVALLVTLSVCYLHVRIAREGCPLQTPLLGKTTLLVGLVLLTWGWVAWLAGQDLVSGKSTGWYNASFGLVRVVGNRVTVYPWNVTSYSGGTRMWHFDVATTKGTKRHEIWVTDREAFEPFRAEFQRLDRDTKAGRIPEARVDWPETTRRVAGDLPVLGALVVGSALLAVLLMALVVGPGLARLRVRLEVSALPTLSSYDWQESEHLLRAHAAELTANQVQQAKHHLATSMQADLALYRSLLLHNPSDAAARAKLTASLETLDRLVPTPDVTAELAALSVDPEGHVPTWIAWKHDDFERSLRAMVNGPIPPDLFVRYEDFPARPSHSGTLRRDDQLTPAGFRFSRNRRDLAAAGEAEIRDLLRLLVAAEAWGPQEPATVPPAWEDKAVLTLTIPGHSTTWTVRSAEAGNDMPMGRIGAFFARYPKAEQDAQAR